MEEALSEGGFELAIAASGEEAVTLLSGNQGQYQALVTDISLRGRFDGWEVARRAREINPGFPIVYMSGRHAEDWASKGVPNSIMLAKPFAPAQLSPPFPSFSIPGRRPRKAAGLLPIAAVFIFATVPCLVVKVRASLAFPPVTASTGRGLSRPTIS